MSLDIFQSNQAAAIADAARFSRPDLPATFGDTLGAAWDNGVLFGQSFAFINARNRAMEDIANEAYAKTRDERLRFDNVFEEYARSHQQFVDVYNKRLAQVLAENPEREVSGFPAVDLKPLTDDDISARGEQLSRDARDAYKIMARRERTWGGTFGMLGGSGGAGVVDPVNVLTFPLAAPAGLGIVKTGLAWAAIGGGTQTAIEALGAPYREQVEPGYLTSGEPAENVLEAAGFAGGLGAALKALGTGWRYLKTKTDWPRTMRDAGNVVESEAQVAESNPFPPSPQSEVAHRSAATKAVDDVIAGKPVDVERDITPDMVGDYERRLSPILKARQAAITAGERAEFLAREDARLPGTMERLSEQQLAEIRGAADELDTGLTARQAALTEQVEKARGAAAEQAAKVDELHREIQELSARAQAAARPEERVLDMPTERRLAAALKKMPAARERLARLEAVAEERAAALPSRQLTAEARAATRKGRTQREMVKAVTRLADQGYGVKLTAEEAGSMAERVLKAGPDELEATLRETTEALVDKARAQRAVAPPQPFGQMRPHEEQRATAARITSVLTGRVQSLAREAGYVMPRDEAGTIAARLLKVTEPDALAILDELVVRPRTLAKTLAEPPPSVPADLPKPPERIAAAAVRVEGETYTGTTHAEAYEKAIGRPLTADQRVPNLGNDSGFVTNAGRFVTRDEALDIARSADQVHPARMADRLLAEDLKEAPIAAAQGEKLVRELATNPANDRALAEQLATPVAKVVGDPEHAATMEREFQKMRAETPDKEIPIGRDADGNPITRTVEETAEEIEQRRLLADEVKASCGPQPPEGEGGGGSTAAGLAAAGAGGGGLLAASGGGEAQAQEGKPLIRFTNKPQSDVYDQPRRDVNSAALPPFPGMDPKAFAVTPMEFVKQMPLRRLLDAFGLSGTAATKELENMTPEQRALIGPRIAPLLMLNAEQLGNLAAFAKSLGIGKRDSKNTPAPDQPAFRLLGEPQGLDMQSRPTSGHFDDLTDEQRAQLPPFDYLNALSGLINRENFDRMLQETRPSDNVEDRRGKDGWR
jgi:hypothetical protein